MIKADNSLYDIAKWMSSEDAKHLICLETSTASEFISDVFGYYVVQLGD